VSFSRRHPQPFLPSASFSPSRNGRAAAPLPPSLLATGEHLSLPAAVGALPGPVTPAVLLSYLLLVCCVTA